MMRWSEERCGLMPLYAHRLKGIRGDSWRILESNFEFNRVAKEREENSFVTSNQKRE